MRVPESMRDLGWELPHTFLGLDEDASDFGKSRAVILPVPYEATTSFGAGTGAGPGAIIEASRYIELYDQELDSEPYEVGVATLPALSLTGAGPRDAIAELRAAYDKLLDEGRDKFVIMLGGEHSVSSAPVLAWTDRLAKQGKRLSVLQFDAHTDLRPEYEGSPYSHASVMHRVQWPWWDWREPRATRAGLKRRHRTSGTPTGCRRSTHRCWSSTSGRPRRHRCRRP